MQPELQLNGLISKHSHVVERASQVQTQNQLKSWGETWRLLWFIAKNPPKYITKCKNLHEEGIFPQGTVSFLAGITCLSCPFLSRSFRAVLAVSGCVWRESSCPRTRAQPCFNEIPPPAFLCNLPTRGRGAVVRDGVTSTDLGSAQDHLLNSRPAPAPFPFKTLHTNTCTHTSALTSSLPPRLKYPILLAFPPYLFCLCSHSDPLNDNLPFFPGNVSRLLEGFLGKPADSAPRFL